MSQRLWELIVSEADLIGHLDVLKDFYLLGRGELFLAFIDQSQALLSAPPSATTQHGIAQPFLFFFISIHAYFLFIAQIVFKYNN